MQPEAKVRLAKSDDLAGVQALYCVLRPHDPPLSPAEAAAAFGQVLAQPHLRVLVCEVEGELVATCMLAVIDQLANGARPFGVIEHVVTLPAHRGSGHARRVLEAALAEAWASRCGKVMLLSGAQRTEAHHLYASLGFDGDVERGFVARPPGGPGAVGGQGNAHDSG